MQKISLNNTPSQKLSLSFNEVNFDISLITIEGITFMTVKSDGQPLINNAKCYANIPAIQYSYLSQKGNFMFISDKSQYPFYENFGKTCNLYYLTPEEVQEVLNV